MVSDTDSHARLCIYTLQLRIVIASQGFSLPHQSDFSLLCLLLFWSDSLLCLLCCFGCWDVLACLGLSFPVSDGTHNCPTSISCSMHDVFKCMDVFTVQLLSMLLCKSSIACTPKSRPCGHMGHVPDAAKAFFYSLLLSESLRCCTYTMV
jgi:hypothetical protein